MIGLTQQGLLLLAVVWNALFALATLFILWNARCRAVYFWVLSGLGGSGFAWLSAGSWYPTLYDAWSGQWLLGITVVGSAWIKATAIGVLADRRRSLRPFFYLGGSVLGGVLLIPLLPLERQWFSLYVLLCLGLLMLVLAREAFHTGRTNKLWNARILALVVAGQAVFVVTAALASVATGIDPLRFNPDSVSLVTVVFNFSAALANTALFISLVLDINLQQREEIQQRLTVAEIDRSRRDERIHMLADMHDGLGSQLATARLKLERGAMEQRELAELVTECIADMHLMVDSLRGEGETLAEVLADYRVRIERRLAGSKIRVVWRIKLDDAPALAPKPMLQVLRIMQEAINNALKHAKPTEIVVSARHVAGSGFDIRIEDDGIGICPDNLAGRGLDNLRRRAGEIDASLSIERRGPGGGTRVALRFV